MKMVARDGIEPPPPAFSGLCSCKAVGPDSQLADGPKLLSLFCPVNWHGLKQFLNRQIRGLTAGKNTLNNVRC
jgi:hypothetical protein